MEERRARERGAWRDEFCSRLKPVDRLTPLSHTLVRTLNIQAVLMCLYLLSVLGSSHVNVNECICV